MCKVGRVQRMMGLLMTVLPTSEGRFFSNRLQSPFCLQSNIKLMSPTARDENQTSVTQTNQHHIDNVQVQRCMTESQFGPGAKETVKVKRDLHKHLELFSSILFLGPTVTSVIANKLFTSTSEEHLERKTSIRDLCVGLW